MVYQHGHPRVHARAKQAVLQCLYSAGIPHKSTRCSDIYGLRVDVSVDPADLGRARARIAAKFGRSYGPIRIVFTGESDRVEDSADSAERSPQNGCSCDGLSPVHDPT